jgi:hypothetical protein
MVITLNAFSPGREARAILGYELADALLQLPGLFESRIRELRGKRGPKTSFVSLNLHLLEADGLCGRRLAAPGQKPPILCSIFCDCSGVGFG